MVWRDDLVRRLSSALWDTDVCEMWICDDGREICDFMCSAFKGRYHGCRWD